MRNCLTTKFSRFFECGAALFMVFLLDSKGAEVCSEALFMVFVLDPEGGKVCTRKCKSCRSRQELSKFTILLANFGVDTAENGPLKVCQHYPRVRKNFQKSQKT